jgi:hypothetical protein
MTHTVIEATSAAQRDEFKKTADYLGFVKNATQVTEGVTFDNVEGEGPPVDLYWILVEDEKDEDNATFRINDEGVAVFSSSGVEV